MGNEIKNSNYFTIQGWMRNELELSGNYLNCYAIIYCFSQTKENRYTGTIQYLATWLGVTKRALRNILNKLIEKGYIIKHEQMVESSIKVEYSVDISIVESVLNKDFLNKEEKGNLVTQIDDKNEIIQKISENKSSIEDFLEKDVIEKFKPIIQKWINYKKEKKQTYKLIGLKMFYKRLLKLSNGDFNTANEIVEESMANNWAGVFEPKNKKNEVDVRINKMIYDNEW